MLPSSGRRVWWACPAGHGWAAPVSARTHGTGCPDCPRGPAAPTLLAGHPDLAAQWDTAANGELTTAVTAGSHRRVGWRCAHGHHWNTRICSRTRGAGCPSCAGHLTTPETSLAALHPDLLDQWAHHLNATLDPTTVRPHL